MWVFDLVWMKCQRKASFIQHNRIFVSHVSCQMESSFILVLHQEQLSTCQWTDSTMELLFSTCSSARKMSKSSKNTHLNLMESPLKACNKTVKPSDFPEVLKLHLTILKSLKLFASNKQLCISQIQVLPALTCLPVPSNMQLFQKHSNMNYPNWHILHPLPFFIHKHTDTCPQMYLATHTPKWKTTWRSVPALPQVQEGVLSHNSCLFPR